MKYMIAVIASLLLADIAVAHTQTKRNESPASAGAVAPSARPAAAVVDAFHAALRRGDAQAALSSLTENALIYEAGGVERNRQEYASHHLGADSAFSQAVPSTVSKRAGDAVGTVAWIATEGRTTGTYKGKTIDQLTTETMVLRRVGGAWKIAHIHWSSAAAK